MVWKSTYKCKKYVEYMYVGEKETGFTAIRLLSRNIILKNHKYNNQNTGFSVKSTNFLLLVPSKDFWIKGLDLKCETFYESVMGNL